MQAENDIAVLDQGSVITPRRRLQMDMSLDYSHAARSRVIFRGIEVPQSVLVGVFDINESRQNSLSSGLSARFGVSDRLELNARVPLIARWDQSVLSPVTAAPGTDVGTRDFSVNAKGIGDMDFGLRYQGLAEEGRPFFTVGLQVLAPTGSDPFSAPRDGFGNATRSFTGSGFWGVTSSITALMPTDPAVLFASFSYGVNFARNVRRFVGDTYIDRVKPSGEPSLSLGIGLSLNPRTSISFGYGHTWSFGTWTRVQVMDRSRPEAPVLGPPVEGKSRDLQIGRLLLGVTYRASEKRTFNWNLEFGATDDAGDVRMSLRVPILN